MIVGRKRGEGQREGRRPHGSGSEGEDRPPDAEAMRLPIQALPIEGLRK